MNYCSHCGSMNHQSFDCKTPEQTYVPPASEPPAKPAAAPPAVAEPVFEPKLRWPGAPPICTAANLPSFEDQSAIDEYRERNGNALGRMRKTWRCDKCGGLHYEAAPRSPSGESSGNTRESVLPPGFKPFMRKIRPSAFGPSEATLPVQPALAKVMSLPAKAAPAQRQRKEGELL